MCNVDPDSAQLMPKGRHLDSNDQCRKCSESASVLLRGKDAYCNNCFLVYFIHKFRSTIGKSKQIKPNDKILICHSGGKNSLALLHLIQRGLDEESHKKLRFSPTFLHVIDNGCNIRDAEKLCSEIIKFKFKCYCVHLNQVINVNHIRIFEATDRDATVSFVDDKDCEDRLKMLLKSCASQTAREDLSLHLRYDLITKAAAQLGFYKVFLGDNASQISTRILSHIALGRGAHLADHVHFKSIHSGISIYRPMRELLENEVDHYLRIFNILPPLQIAECTSDPASSINSCSKNFIKGLQEEFPATVPTIFKTGNKVVSTMFDSSSASNVTAFSSCPESASEQSCQASEVSSINEQNQSLCSTCGFILDTSQGVSSALEAKLISKEISKLQPGVQYEAHRLNEKSEDSDGLPELGPSQQFDDQMCYGCRNILQDLPGDVSLPRSLSNQRNSKISLEEMRTKIQEFLIS